MGYIEDNILKIVKEKGKTVGWLAGQIGMSRAGFNKMIETGSVKVDTLIKITEVLGVSVASIFIVNREMEEWTKHENTTFNTYIMTIGFINSLKEIRKDVENLGDNDIALSTIDRYINTYEKWIKLFVEQNVTNQ